MSSKMKNAVVQNGNNGHKWMQQQKNKVLKFLLLSQNCSKL